MRCRKCGNELKPEQKFCSVCGNPIFSKKKQKRKNKLRNIFLKILFCGIAISLVGLVVAEKLNKKEILAFRENEELYYSPVQQEHIVQNGKSGIEYVDNELLVTFQENVQMDEIEKLVSQYKGSVVGYIQVANICQIQLEDRKKEEELEKICNELCLAPEVLDAKLNIILGFEMAEYPNDKKWKNLWSEIPDGKNWGMEAIHAPKAWDYIKEMNSVNVGIYDNMFHVHEDLDIQELMCNVDDSKIDDSHGTHVAGIIGAIYNNKKGICGVFPKAQIYAVSYKKAEKNYKNSIFAMQAGLAYLIHLKQCKVINMSMANDELTFAANRSNQDAQEFINEYEIYLGDYLEKFLNAGDDFVICKAAGNQNSLDKSNGYKYIRAEDGDEDAFCGYIPYDKEHEKAYKKYEHNLQDRIEYGNVDVKWDLIAAISNSKIKDRIIVVGAVQNEGNGQYSVCDFSNWGDRVDIVAPGKSIYSTALGKINIPFKSFIVSDYIEMSGTSMAAPFVSGVSAMLFSLDSTLDGAEVKRIICGTATGDIKYSGIMSDSDYSYSMVNAESAVKEVIERRNYPETEMKNFKIDGNIYEIYKSAAEKSISSGNWREEVRVTGDMNLVSSDQREKVKTKATLEAACNVENYDEKNLSKLKVSGDGKIQAAGQNLAWTVDYSDGVAHYQYTEPTSYTNDVAIDPICFQFNVLTREMMQDASVSGDTISFTLSGDDMAQVTSEAMNMMNGIENLKFDNGIVKILIDKEAGIISGINMTFHASMEYMGYQADVDYDVEYQFIPTGSSKSSETEQVSEGENGTWYGQFDESKVPEGAGEYNGHYYYAYNLDSVTNWEDAKQYCEQMGGYLATVTSREEDEFLYSYLQNKFHYENAYFGFTDKAEEGKWKWSNGEESSYTNWHEGEPNAENPEEDFVMYYYKYSDGSWNDGDFDAGTVNGGTVFICEWGEYQTGSNVVEGSAEELYSSIITEYHQAFSDNVDYSYEELKGKYPYVNQSLVSLYFEGSKPFYGFYDVDGNGVDELFIGYETIAGYEYKIVDILTYETESGQIRNIGDGEVFSVNAGSFVYDTGVIYNIKADNIARFYRISSDGYHLELIKSYTLVKNQDNRFYFNDTEMLDGEEFDKMLREQGNQVPFEWSPLDEI